MYLENNYAFLQQAGQWFWDSATGQLFYKAASGQNPNSLDIELPKQQSLPFRSAAVTAARSAASFSPTSRSPAPAGWARAGGPGSSPTSGRHVPHRHLEPALRSATATAAASCSRPPGSTGAPNASGRAGLRGHQHHLQRRHLHRPRPGRPRHRQRSGRQLQRDRPGRRRHHRHRQRVQRRRGQRDRGRRSPGQRPPPEQPGDDQREHHDQRQPHDGPGPTAGDGWDPVASCGTERDDHPQPGRPPALRRHRHRLGLGHQRPGRQPGLRKPGHLQLPAHLHHPDHAEKRHGLLQPDLRQQERDA